MDVTAYSDGCSDRGRIGLLCEDGGGFLCDQFDLLLRDRSEIPKIVNDDIDLCLVGHLNYYYLCSVTEKSDL